MRHTVRAIATVLPLRFPDRVEVQALLLGSNDHLTGTGKIYAPESWQVWRTRLDVNEAALDGAEFTLARGEAVQLGVVIINLPADLFGREFALEPS